ncbi:YcnI family copper-binding membrane protein [Nocardioides nematodiphilus]|uniref:YcnI family copper-binding membrane protein n=1 Tax=Nocardioides nematodiphilus TaxID=2849669 RepID=UPI001CD92BB2|nr:YcnI family protein [Nocardioides nematodiphilus]MCA1984819.1 YcnI family protein [Nocardioides nematodiphilus]
MTRRSALRLALAAAPALAIVGLALPASAHVTVNPNTATAGGYTKLTFRVPTESDTASTTKVAVYFPADHPFASVGVKPHPGWSFKVSDQKLKTPISSDDGQVTEAVSRIVWTADSAANAIKPGEFEEFDVSVGPLPDSGSLEFKALQTYSDGSVVRWIQDTVAGQDEPEHPAPVLTIVQSAATNPSSAASTAASGPDSSSATSAKPTTVVTEKDSSHTPMVLSIIALVLAVVAVGAAAVAVLRRRP